MIRHASRALNNVLKFGDCRNANDPSIYVLVAQVNQHVVGAVAVKEWPGGDISVARLFVAYDWRHKGIGRRIMQQIFVLYPDSAAWLYATPYTWENTQPSLNADELQRFYMSLGFHWTTDNDGKPVMVRRKL